MPRILSFKDAILEAQDICLSNDKSVFLIGEGVPDPKAVFGSTKGLLQKFPKQVFDSPVSENAVTGVLIGCAVSGLRPILVHQRIDFSLYSADQIINMAAKIHSMYGGKLSCPLVIRMIVGRGWGQGNQHSQNLTSLYAHVPGLKIVCPSSAYDAKGLFISAVRDPNPVLFIEHRWLYETTSDVPEGPYEIPLTHIREPNINAAITVVSSGYATLETKSAIERLKGIEVDHVDLRVIKPLPIENIARSVMKTGRLLVVDEGWEYGGVGAEIIAELSCLGVEWKEPPLRLSYPNFPSASSPHLTKNYYPGPYDIAKHIIYLLDGRPCDDLLAPAKTYQENRTHDVPDQNFRGPF